ncbi:MAG: ATP-binding protein [Pirellulales bacterium]|nr:ATP-binding protein [Pirellulales bacterium]
MPIPQTNVNLGASPPDQDLRLILEAWQGATQRLEQTHETLRGEVHRLTAELEIKNRELARKNRLADLGQMAAHIAHEVRNTLMPVRLYVSLLERRLREDAEGMRQLEQIQAGLTALESTVQDLLHFTVEREVQAVEFAVLPLIDATLDSLAPQFAAQRVVCHRDLGVDRLLWADPDLLRRALLNLALNALDVLPRGGEITVTAVSTSRGWELEIADNGPGWTTEQLRRATEPFFTTKAHGTGLGLAIVERIVTAHRGELLLHNCPEGGAAVTICLPASRAGEYHAGDDAPHTLPHPSLLRNHSAPRTTAIPPYQPGTQPSHLREKVA